jgi:hypothetical protein
VSDYSTKANQLDANLTAIAMLARAHPEAHYVQVRAWEAKRRWQRAWWDALLGAVVLMATWAAWALVAALLAGCSATWTRLPDPKPGVSAYKVEVRWGLELP